MAQHATQQIKQFFVSKNPWRQFAVLCCVVFLGSSPFFLFDLVEVGHRFEWFLGILLVASAIVLLVPSFTLGGRWSEDVLARIEFPLALAMLLSWIGAMGPYRWGFGYDSFVHFAASALAPVALVTMIQARRPSRQFFLLVITTLTLGLLVEAGEWLGDEVIGTTMFGEVGQSDDTWQDLRFDFLGALIGSALVIGWKRH